MLKTLLYPLGIYRLKLKMHSLQSQIKRIESLTYINLQTRMQLSKLKKRLTDLYESQASLQPSEFIVSGMQKH